ncbi:hypothetical protein [Corallococcus carmarthensis]|uniref:hypothetical protein n=1 Tax=Corallococcus carmarthensis TaxID=2316728 RepID=UPI00148D8E7F|nr:hypothetical protein [Corallococcus carmarthensis]NOK17499.1 hypothetical protein [Corallococcus carmarthensis]
MADGTVIQGRAVRRALMRVALALALTLAAACPPTDPPPTDGTADAGDVTDAGPEDAGVPDASVGCALPAPQAPEAPWASRCDATVPADTCASLVLPAAGPVPPAERWCEDSARLLCAAGVDAGTVEPTAESGCVEREQMNCASRFPLVSREAGYLTYWPEAASACLSGEVNPSSTVCGCAFVRASVGAACGMDAHCRTGYCLKDASDAGVCVACPERRPVGSPCGQVGDAPCDEHGSCAQGCCVPRPDVGEACSFAKPCDPDTSSGCRPLSHEDTAGVGTCRAYRQDGETCGQDTRYECGFLPAPLCDLGTCVPGRVCTFVSPDASVPRQCQPEGVRCDARGIGCGPGQLCPGPNGLCIAPDSLSEGEACTGPGQCAEGLLCDKGVAGTGVCITAGPGECRYDVECPWAERCLDGHCTEGKALGAACDKPQDCAKYLICARGEDGGATCAPQPRLGERCRFTGPDGGAPSWQYLCLTGSCSSKTGLCE